MIWATGLGSFPSAEGVAAIAQQYGLVGRSTGTIVVGWAVATGTLLVVAGAFTALGEEIGWRGFLVPELARRTTWHRVALISGVIWVLWHTPLILFADYHGNTPLWFSLAAFALMTVAICVPLTWLRLRSGSLWPAVLLHAAHNAWVQAFFNPITGDTGATAWMIGEFGIGLAVVTVCLAAIFWRRQLAPSLVRS